MKTKALLTLLIAVSSLTAFAQKSELKEYIANISDGRNILIQPHFQNKDHVTGRIAINFVVDKKGNVIAAHADAKKTTAKNMAFVHQCEDAVKQAKFSGMKKGGPETQNGSVSFAY
jgi:hypothetical protein